MKKKNITSDIFIIVIIIIAIMVYRKYDYNFYSKGISESGKTVFSRDSSETTNNKRSYKVYNKDYNDAIFYKAISVKKYTPYKITCMVKTSNVQQLDNVSVAGAQIILKGTEEHSEVLSGNNDWTKLEFCFNSKNNDKVEIGFRLGGNGYETKGTAWFSELSIEEGFQSEDTTWNFACFIFNNVNAKLDNGIQIKESLTNAEVYNFKDSMRRFKTSAAELSKSKMQVTYNVMEISEPITTLTYDEENGYYISEKDVYSIIEQYLKNEEFDHIFICTKLPNENQLGLQNVTDWIGLGSMEYCGKGFSNIRIPESNTDGIYTYSNNNNFPEEVLLHEFLHTLERNSGEYGFEVPELHSNSNYGYQESRTDGLRLWYKDYMNKEIKGNIGLPNEIYKYKPVQLSNFKYSNKLTLLDEPRNPIERMQSIINQITRLFKKSDEQKQITVVS